ncbi:MAG: ribosome maturation factor RimP [Deltaproteobacteria bacterium]|nr:ribosome maturation factor RimP [Deltaproteobacteria bacterium]MBW2387665.1 ribosome maturation factor RimP [Deltaproteobacteria bacterium]MBW2724725.1 ribosome maturation factor RimP [Deltaproteobacteria bacterium]
MYHDIPEDLRLLVEPIVHDYDCELVDVIERRSAAEGLIRIIIDQVSGDGRVSIENIESISREVEVQLDASDYMMGATMTGAKSANYRLEVSSPGLDRILAREKDFVAAVGSKVSLQTRRPIESRKRFKGMLMGFENGFARLEVESGEVQIPFGEVEKANSIYQFSRDDFAGGSTGGASK